MPIDLSQGVLIGGEHMALVRIHPNFLSALLVARETEALQCVQGVPLDAKLKGMAINQQDGMLYLTFTHPTFPLPRATDGAVAEVPVNYRTIKVAKEEEDVAG